MDPKAPVGDPTYTDGVDANGNIDPDVTDKKNSKYYKERILHNDGSVTVKVYERHTNTLVQTKQDPPNAAQKKAWDDAQPKPQTPGQVATDNRAVELERQRKKNRELPADQDPRDETDAERAKRADDTIAAQKAETEKAKADKIAADKAAEVEARAKAAEVRAQAAADRQAAADARAAEGGGTVVGRPDGTYIVFPDGREIKTNVPGVPGPSSTQVITDVNDEKWTVTVAADGTQTVTKLPISSKKVSGTPVPSSATGWTPDPSQVDLGFGARRKEVAELLESGAIGDPTLQETVDKANALLKQDYETATLVSTNLGTIQTGETEIYKGDIRQREGEQGQANARLTSATNVFDDAIKAITASGSKAKSGASVVGALEEMFNNYKLFAQQFGGALDQTPRVEPGQHMSRKAPVFQPLAMVAAPGTPGQPADPLAPAPPPGGSGLEAASPVGFPPAVPGVPPGTGMESANPVGFPQTAPIPADVTGIPMPPLIGPDGTPVPPPGSAPVPLPEPPSMPEPQPPPVPMPEPALPSVGPPPVPLPEPPPLSPPTTLTDQAAMAQRILGVPATSAPVPPAPAPFAPADPIQAMQAQTMVGQTPRTVGGSLAWAQELGFPPDVLDAFMQIEGGQQMVA